MEVKMVEIKLTDEQYKNLVQLVYLGEWVINSFREERIKRYEDLEQQIYSFSKKAGLKKDIEFDEEDKLFYPTMEFEEKMQEYIDEYDDFFFWEQLVERLSARDFQKQYGEDNVRKMDIDEMVEKGYPFIEKYTDEFQKNGIENLEIKTSIKIYQ